MLIAIAIYWLNSFILCSNAFLLFVSFYFVSHFSILSSFCCRLPLFLFFSFIYFVCLHDKVEYFLFAVLLLAVAIKCLLFKFFSSYFRNTQNECEIMNCWNQYAIRCGANEILFRQKELNKTTKHFALIKNRSQIFEIDALFPSVTHFYHTIFEAKEIWNSKPSGNQRVLCALIWFKTKRNAVQTKAETTRNVNEVF